LILSNGEQILGLITLLIVYKLKRWKFYS